MTRSPAPVTFVKASACGNDFLILDGASAPGDIAGYTRRICDRHNGVGADGVEWLYPAPDADIEARLINADGSAAEISGNGTRCVAAWLAKERALQEVVIRTGAGLKRCRLKQAKGSEFEFEMEMGIPQVAEPIRLQLAWGEVSGVPVSMGNPHFAILVETFAAGWQEQAATIQSLAEFPAGVNVEYIRVRDRHTLEARFFERGAGETQSSGTGSCASAVAAIAMGRAESPVQVQAAGGVQRVGWQTQVTLQGPARLVCRGEFFD